MKKVLITGGSGLIGSLISQLLTDKGYEVIHLSRSEKPQSKYKTFIWDIQRDFIDTKLPMVDAVIHLAGENISAKRWTDEQKRRLEDSRVKSAQLLFTHFKNHPPKTYISASGANYYGTATTQNIYQESDDASKDFLGQLCVKWEQSSDEFKKLGSRVVCLRTPVVLDKNDGALKKLATPIKWYVGSPLGSGKQFVPWVHLDDLCQAYVYVLENEKCHGAFNVAGDQHITNQELTQAVAKALKKPLWAPKVPAFVLKLLFGEMASIILEGSRIDNQKLKDFGFSYQYQHIAEALDEIYKKS